MRLLNILNYKFRAVLFIIAMCGYYFLYTVNINEIYCSKLKENMVHTL